MLHRIIFSSCKDTTFLQEMQVFFVKNTHSTVFVRYPQTAFVSQLDVTCTFDTCYHHSHFSIFNSQSSILNSQFSIPLHHQLLRA